MKETTLFMIRHGRLINSDKPFFTGQADMPLSDEGWKETTNFLEPLSKKNISLVLSSDLERTAKPAKFYSEALNCPLKISKELREINAGRWENKSYQDVMRSETEYLKLRYQDPLKIPFPEGENLKDLKKRVINCLRGILKSCSDENILLVGHAGVIRVIVLHYLKIPLKQFFCFEVDYGSLTVLRFFEDGNVTLKLFNYKDQL
ncbi:MAG: alpha-ribazole phosphatase [bacterium]